MQEAPGRIAGVLQHRGAILQRRIGQAPGRRLLAAEVLAEHQQFRSPGMTEHARQDQA